MNSTAKRDRGQIIRLVQRVLIQHGAAAARLSCRLSNCTAWFRQEMRGWKLQPVRHLRNGVNQQTVTANGEQMSASKVS
jgi:hypothetical protein